MILLLITLFFLHWGCSISHVITAHLGETVTLTCPLPKTTVSRNEVHWYKQSIGYHLKEVVTLWQNTKPIFGAEFSAKRWETTLDESHSNLTISDTSFEDEAIYHCGIREWIRTVWCAMYLVIKGDTQRTSSLTVTQTFPETDLEREGDSVNLQCSVLSDDDTEPCSRNLSVFWVREESNTSPANIFYVDNERHGECRRSSEGNNSCSFHFFKRIRVSDVRTYHCAVATCGKIIFGNRKKSEMQDNRNWSQGDTLLIYILCAVLAVSLTVIVSLVYAVRCKECSHSAGDVIKTEHSGDPKSQKECKETYTYTAVMFTKVKHGEEDKKAMQLESLYSVTKVFELD